MRQAISFIGTNKDFGEWLKQQRYILELLGGAEYEKDNRHKQ